ncbi:unnamed protein product [Cyclocybe aegerita]|uniref:Uncharacterized protein n=1 Tax=Cyclocybe aegerita TaxID=1973307 RepID=A0A8S0W2I8_CYCAE|nr:unnamed protein product [Cyclocybe aegerita]
MFFPPIAFLCALPLVHSVAVHLPHDSHEASGSLPSSWFHQRDHPVHALFRRAPGDGNDYPAVGTPQWSAGFPPASGAPDPSLLPAEWVNALNAAVAAGRIPDIPRSSNTPQTNPVYPQGVNPNSPEVCSATYKCRIQRTPGMPPTVSSPPPSTTVLCLLPRPSSSSLVNTTRRPPTS